MSHVQVSQGQCYPAQEYYNKPCAIRRSAITSTLETANGSGNIPRPSNCFIIFRSFFNDQNGNSNQRRVSKVAGNVWKSMTEEQRRPFRAQAVREKTAHRLKYPNYVYRRKNKNNPKASKGTQVAEATKAQRAETVSSIPSPMSSIPSPPSSSSSSCLSYSLIASGSSAASRFTTLPDDQIQTYGLPYFLAVQNAGQQILGAVEQCEPLLPDFIPLFDFTASEIPVLSSPSPPFNPFDASFITEELDFEISRYFDFNYGQ